LFLFAVKVKISM